MLLFLVRKQKKKKQKGGKHYFEMSDIQSFFGKQPIPSNAVRMKLKMADVPQDDEGLKQLASCECWLAVLQLAEKLEQNFINQDSKERGNNEKALKYTVVRITAFVKMSDYERAEQLLQRIGSVLKEPWNAAGKLVLPFSMLFLNAVIPGMRGQVTVSQSRLYDLLALCDAQVLRCSTALTATASTVEWRQRCRRVRRALVTTHFEQGDWNLAIKLMSDLAEGEVSEVRHILSLQQVGLLCLRTGNSQHAEEVFRSIAQNLDDDDDDEGIESSNSGWKKKETLADVKETKRFVVLMNKAFLSVFQGKFTEAVLLLRGISDAPAACLSSVGVQAVSLQRRCSKAMLLACSPYYAQQQGAGGGGVAHGNTFTSGIVVDASNSLQGTLNKADDMIRSNPREMLCLDATCYNMLLLSTLNGDDATVKMTGINALQEHFRCGKESIPKIASAKI